jgi:hypothetical protein
MLVQVLVSAAIMGILALVGSNILTNQMQSMTFLQDQVERNQLTRELDTLLLNKTSCLLNLSGTQLLEQSTQPTPLQRLSYPDGSLFLQSNLERGQLKIGQMELINSPLPSTIELVVPMERTRHGGGSSQLKPYRISLIVSRDNRGEIVSCDSSSGGFAIDYDQCITIEHSDTINSSGWDCGGRVVASHARCPTNFVMVEVSTGLRLMNTCKPARAVCCRARAM